MLATSMAVAFALVNAGGHKLDDRAPRAGEARVEQVQMKLSWSGSWIWTPENREWVDKDNHSSIELLQGNTVKFCMNGSCWQVNYSDQNGIYSFRLNSTSKAYYEFWLGDFNSLEGRFWFDRANEQAPAAMIRMMQN
ncbi:hypothetical protein [Jiella pacifica]|uniref:Uncharacterized protein n=1 Tax=Jiella pacifica TaxID=2696469 RepID=A0A6N9T677_9HYPH|nr:hypothetical protein [Jiella pacifica]NDW05279.1 hypothetical protein [Jiella pacifica]